MFQAAGELDLISVGRCFSIDIRIAAHASHARPVKPSLRRGLILDAVDSQSISRGDDVTSIDSKANKGLVRSYTVTHLFFQSTLSTFSSPRAEVF